MLKSLGLSVAMLAIAASGRVARAQAGPPGSVRVVLEPLGDDDDPPTEADTEAETETEAAPVETAAPASTAASAASPCPSAGAAAPAPCPSVAPCGSAPPCPSLAPCGSAPPCPSLAPCGSAPPCGSWLRGTVDELPPRRDRSEARDAVIAGAMMLALGEAVSAFHALHDPSMHGIELVPVAGPVIGIFQYHPGPEWATPLLIASWLDAAGILTMAVAAAYLPRERHLSIGAASTGRDSRLSVSFTF